MYACNDVGVCDACMHPAVSDQGSSAQGKGLQMVALSRRKTEGFETHLTFIIVAIIDMRGMLSRKLQHDLHFNHFP